MSCLVKDLKGWIKKGKGKMSVNEINENPTYYKIMVREIEKGNPRFHCQVYSDKEEDRVSENYIANDNTSPEQVLEILLTWIFLHPPKKTDKSKRISSLVKDIGGWTKKGKGIKSFIEINEYPTDFEAMVSWIKTGKTKFYCKVQDRSDKNYIVNENTSLKQVFEILFTLIF